MDLSSTNLVKSFLRLFILSTPPSSSSNHFHQLQLMLCMVAHSSSVVHHTWNKAVNLLPIPFLSSITFKNGVRGSVPISSEHSCFHRDSCCFLSLFIYLAERHSNQEVERSLQSSGSLPPKSTILDQRKKPRLLDWVKEEMSSPDATQVSHIDGTDSNTGVTSRRAHQEKEDCKWSGPGTQASVSLCQHLRCLSKHLLFGMF